MGPELVCFRFKIYHGLMDYHYPADEAKALHVTAKVQGCSLVSNEERGRA